MRAVRKVEVAAECLLIRKGRQCFTTELPESSRPASICPYNAC